MDKLFEKKHKRNLRERACYQSILNRVKRRIYTVCKSGVQERYSLVYHIPLFQLSHPGYSQEKCISFLIDELHQLHFSLQFLPPDSLYISWKNYVPLHDRLEIQHKTGLVLNPRGQIISTVSPEEEEEKPSEKKEGKKYTSLDQYCPSKNSVYRSEHFQSIQSTTT